MESEMFYEQHRYEEIDLIKGIGIFCMVAGHSGVPGFLGHFIYLFHMAIFFIASGYCYKDSNASDWSQVIEFTKRKLKSLWMPYVIWTMIYSCLHNFFITMNIYTNNPVLNQYVPDAELTNYWTLQDIIKNVLKSLLMHGGTQMGGAFWFLAILLKISLLYCCVDFIIRRLLGERYIVLGQGIISILFLLAGYYCYLSNHVLSGYDKVLSFYILFYMGYMLKKYQVSVKGKHLINFMFCLGVLLVMMRFGRIELVANEYVNPLYLLVASFAGWQFLYEISFGIKKYRIKNIILYFGKHTMPIIILHFLSFKIVSLVGVLCLKLPLCLVAAFPVLYYGKLWCIAYIVVGLAIPLISDNLWNRFYIKVMSLH